MAASVVLTIESDLSQGELQSRLRVGAAKPREGLQAAKVFLNGVAAGAHRAKLSVQTGASAPVQASGTITCASVANNDTIIIGGLTFTAKTSPSGSVEFTRGVSDTADAADLAAKINAHATLSLVVSAAAASGVVTLTALQPGVVGNFIATRQGVGSTMTCAAAALTGGTGGAQEAKQTYALGL